MFFSKNHKPPRINKKKLFSHASNSTLNLNYSSKKMFFYAAVYLINHKKTFYSRDVPLEGQFSNKTYTTT